MKTNLFHRALPGRRCLRRASVVALAFVAWGFGDARLSAGDVRDSGNSTVVTQYEQGRRAEHGIGGRANPRAAVRLYREAAGQGHAPAQYALGRLLIAGEGARRDPAEAAHWFSRAAAQGYAPAQNRLGRAHELGFGVARDLAAAARWYAQAAESHPSARVNQHTLTARLTGTQLAEAPSRASSLLPTMAGPTGR